MVVRKKIGDAPIAGGMNIIEQPIEQPTEQPAEQPTEQDIDIIEEFIINVN